MNVGLKMVGDVVVFLPHGRSAHFPIFHLYSLALSTEGDRLDEALDALKADLKKEILIHAAERIENPPKLAVTDNPEAVKELIRQFYARNH